MIMPISPISTRVIIWESMFLEEKKIKHMKLNRISFVSVDKGRTRKKLSFYF